MSTHRLALRPAGTNQPPRPIDSLYIAASMIGCAYNSVVASAATTVARIIPWLHRLPQCGLLPGFASQENITLQISGVKRWRFRRADVRHPLTAFTPHFKARTSGRIIDSDADFGRLERPSGWSTCQ